MVDSMATEKLEGTENLTSYAMNDISWSFALITDTLKLEPPRWGHGSVYLKQIKKYNKTTAVNLYIFASELYFLLFLLCNLCSAIV